MNRREFAKLSTCLAATTLAPKLAYAQVRLPSVVTIVVPFSPGGSNDVFARALAQRLSEELKVNFIVENKPGAGGAIGASQVARSAPNGSKLLLTSNSIITNHVVQANPAFDPLSSFTHIAILNRGPSLVIVNAASRYKDLPGLFAGMKNGSVKTFGSAGIGSSAHLASEMLNYGLGTNVIHVPYKGISNVAVDITGNNIDFVITTGASVSGQLKAGYLKPLGVTSPESSPFYPSLRPVADQIPQYDVEAWWGVFAPANTQSAIAEMLNQCINKISSEKMMSDLYRTESTTAVNFNPEQIKKFLFDEQAKWSSVAKSRNIQPI